jgi:uncharacterized protein YndB with AHSA1/START domain
MTSQGPTLTLSMSRVLAATPEQVFRAFTDPRWHAQWWGPEGARSEVAQMDVRVGGGYRIDMHMPGGAVATMFGRYLEIDPPKLLSYSWQWEGEGVETRVTLEIEPHEDGAELTVTHEGFKDESRVEMHEHGWGGSLDRLERLLPEITK